MAGQLAHHYEAWLVALSVIVAVLASYTGLDLAERAGASVDHAREWLASSAVAMGGGIWSMHFIAVLAFGIAIPITFNARTAIALLILVTLMTGGGLYIAYRRSGFPGLAAAGVSMGLGIIATNYIDVTPARLVADVGYDAALVALSALIVIGASTVALQLAFRRFGPIGRLGAAAAMGTIIAGVHYTGMAAAAFAAQHEPALVHDPTLAQTKLAWAVTIITFLILFAGLIAAMIDRETALRRSEDRLRLALQTSQTGIWDWDILTGRLTWSETTEQLFGIPPRSFEGSYDAFLRLVHPEDRDRVNREVDRSVQAGGAFTINLRIVRSDGDARHLNMRGEVIHDDAGLPIRMSGAATDVTEAKSAETALKASHEHVVEILESINDAFYAVDHEWRFTYVNRQAEQLWGRKREELLGKSLWEEFPAAVKSPSYESHFRAARERRAVHMEYLSTVVGIWIDVSIYPSATGLSVYFRDITGRKRAERELHRLNEHLEQRVEEEIAVRQRAEAALRQAHKMEAIGQLTGGVAHDFNNILTTISGNLELIGRSAQDNERIRQLTSAAQRAAERATRLTSQLLAFSRQQTLHPQTVNVNDRIHDFQALLLQAVGAAIRIEFQFDSGLWSCRIDPVQFESALLNLALNARDAMPRGGTLRVETCNIAINQAAAETNLGLSPGAYVQLSVRDTGTGMSPDIVERAFDPFFTTKEVGKGTGLGLSMVYGFVKQSGGHVTIDSAVGQGTTITLYLPKAELKAALAPTPEGAPNEVKQGSGTVLVVEDDEGVLDVIATTLSELGYTVLQARNSVEAVKVLNQRADVDLLLSDIVMPHGTNGVELARNAKRMYCHIKVLLTSGYTGDTLERLDSSDEFPILSKPFKQADLAHRVQLLLSHH